MTTRPQPRESTPDADAPILDLVSSRLLVLANLLRRGASARYRREFGLAPSEYGLIATLGRRAPVTLSGLSLLIGRDRGQISRSVTGLVARALVQRDPNPDNNREVLISLTAQGLAVHDAMVEIGRDRNASLLSMFDPQDLPILIAFLDGLKRRAGDLLEEEQLRSKEPI